VAFESPRNDYDHVELHVYTGRTREKTKNVPLGSKHYRGINIERANTALVQLLYPLECARKRRRSRYRYGTNNRAEYGATVGFTARN